MCPAASPAMSLPEVEGTELAGLPLEIRGRFAAGSWPASSRMLTVSVGAATIFLSTVSTASFL